MLRHRPITTAPMAAALLAALVFATAVSAGEVYQWTDANGVTHYSQTAPPSGAAKYRVISHRQPEAQAATTQAPEDPQCGVARANIALIEGGGRVQRDTNGDGIPDRDLTPAERDSQLQLARVVLSANCTPPAQNPTASEDTAASGAADEEGAVSNER